MIPKPIKEEKNLEVIKKIYQQWKRRVGEITPEDWKRIEPKLINIIHKVLKEHAKELGELMNQGSKLINKVETIRKELEKILEEITKTQILSIKKI